MVSSTRFLALATCTLALGCSASDEEGTGAGGVDAGGTLATGGMVGTGATGASAPTGGASPATGGVPTTGGADPGTGGTATGGLTPTTGGVGTGGLPPLTGGAPTGGVAPMSGGAPTGGAPTGGAPTGGGGAGGAPSNCPFTGNITYTLNRSDTPTADELDAYDRLTVAMDEALYWYNCYADLEKQLWVNYDTGVPTAQANIDGWMSFGASRDYMVVATAMHEVAHTLGVGYYGFGDMTDGNGIWTGANANAVLASIANPRDTQLHADSMHFWPYGLNYASEHENDDDLINHVRIVAAIRLDLGQ